MPKIETSCPYCKKLVQTTKETLLEAFGQVVKYYSCGHFVSEQYVAARKADDGQKLVCKECLDEVTDIRKHLTESHPNIEPTNYDWIDTTIVSIPAHRHPQYARCMNFQQSGVDFIERANFNCLVGDDMGLGKSCQILVATEHNKEKVTPCLFVVKGSLRLNWLNEAVNKQWLVRGWTAPPDEIPFILLDGKQALIPGFRYVIVGMNLLKKYEKELLTYGFKLIVVDESQNFSNPESQRTKSLRKIATRIPHRVCLSGTPILNRASEFFTTLNLIKPDHWTNYADFIRQWIEIEEYYNEQGNLCRRMKGIKPWRLEAFQERIQPYVIRRRKRDVLTDLPKFTRRFKILESEDVGIKGAYNHVAQELDDYLYSKDYYADSGFNRKNKMLAYLVKMRHIAGLAKVPAILDEVRDFMESTEDNGNSPKLLIGCHHDEVMRQLALGLSNYKPVLLGSGLNNIEREQGIQKFRLPEYRICLAKILAQGEGLNLQFCHNMFFTERQWNPGKEEQFEARIDRYGQTEPSTCWYFIMKNTVDETFSGMVEDKRKTVGETLGDSLDVESDPNLIQFLAESAAKMRM